MSRLIVVKGEPNNFNSELGVVIPIGSQDMEGNFTPVSMDDYPNTGIFISKGYSKIDENFKENELFILRDIQPTENDWEANRRLQKYYALGDWAEHLEHNLLIPIFDMPPPDLATGVCDPSRDLPKGSIFFAEHDEQIYGPFVASREDEAWIASPLTGQSPLNLPNDHVAKFNTLDLTPGSDFVAFDIGGRKNKFITSLKRLGKINSEKIDYITDAKLVKVFAKSGFAKDIPGLGKQEANKLIQQLDAYRKKSKTKDNSPRLARLEKVLPEFLNAADYGKEIIERFLLDNIEGRRYLDNFFSEHRDILVKEKLDEIEKQTQIKKDESTKELNELTRQIEAKNKQLTDIARKVDDERANAEIAVKKIQAQTEEQAHQSLLAKQKELTTKNLQLEEDGKNLSLKCSEIESRYNDLSTIVKLKEEIQYLRRVQDDLNKANIEVERTVQSQRSLVAHPDLSTRLTELKTLLQMLNGQPALRTEQPIYHTIKAAPSKLTKDNRSAFISHLSAQFQDEDGRPLTFEETATLLICLSQSFLTIFTGPPGTGKTSTAVRLAKYLRLYEEDEANQISNFLSIPVGRGWVATRDILGFFNSLKGVYQPSRSGLYQFLKSDSESAINFTKLVLLDEANLSSVEHYWSDFLGMCDSKGAQRTIDIGHSEPAERFLRVGENLRFIATINNDATTEKLSPRLLDRAPIINFSDTAPLSEGSAQVLPEFDGAFGHQDILATFDVSSNEAELRPDQKSAFEEIIAILNNPSQKGGAIKISHRKINSVTRFCHIANEIPEMRSQPLDLAISMHILPLIQGHGQAFKERLSKLDQTLADLEFVISRKRLKSLIEEGDNYAESYSYF